MLSKSERSSHGVIQGILIEQAGDDLGTSGGRFDYVTGVGVTQRVKSGKE